VGLIVDGFCKSRAVLMGRCLGVVVMVVSMMSAWPSVAFARQSLSPTDTVSLRGTVLDLDGKPSSGASVRLGQTGNPSAVETKTDSLGVFVFAGVRSGSYTLIADKSGRRSRATNVVALSGKEQQKIDIVLENSEKDMALPSSPDAMEFADKPNFTVAGVTDWTAVGGHGSDAILRTSEDLSRETLTLRPNAQGSGASAVAGAALVSKDKGELSRALEQVKKSLAEHETADLHRIAGEMNEKLGNPLAAVHEYEQAVRLEPSEQNYFEWGSELLLHRAVWQAQEVFVQGTKAFPKSARMMAGLGAALFSSALYDQAAQRLCDASDLNPAESEPYVFMGKIALVAPDPLPCVEQKLARFVQDQPGNSLANYFYAMAIWKRDGQLAEPQTLQRVEALLKKAVNVDAKCSDAYLQLGILASSQHDLKTAIGYYEKAIEANPQAGDAHYRLGVAYDRTGEQMKAKHEFELHDAIEKQQAEAIEQQRREVKQFQIVLQGQSAYPQAH
jgi:tetratricopeptide (TPR) repeat protein